MCVCVCVPVCVMEYNAFFYNNVFAKDVYYY